MNAPHPHWCKCRICFDEWLAARRDRDTRRMVETPESGSMRSTGSADPKGIAQ